MAVVQTFIFLFKTLATVFIVRCIVVYSYRLFFHPLHSYPGPLVAKLSDWYGAYHALHRRLHVITHEDHLRYGSVVRQGPNKLVFNTAQAVHDIYQNERLSKSNAYLVTQVSPNIFNLFNVIDKQLHRIRRRIVGQALNERAVHQFAPVLEEQINIFLRSLLSSAIVDEAVDMSERCNWLSLDVSGELGFGRSFDLQSSPHNRWMLQGISTSNWRLNTYIQFPAIKATGWENLLLPILLPKVLRFHRMVSSMIKSRLALEKNAKPDLFASVSDYTDPDTGKRLTRRELWSESTFLIPAAGDTVTSLMSAAFFYLSRYEHVYDRLATEVRSTFTRGEEISHGPRLLSCRYLRAFLDETLRISPPSGTTLWRDLSTDATRTPITIDGHHVPPDTRVGVNIYAIHHNAEFFPSPFDFKPERWIKDESGLDERAMKKMHSAFIAFSRGSRNCAGTALAYSEASLVIAKTLWYFDFESDGHDLASGETGRPLVFRMEDQVSSKHSGPLLKFCRRGDAWKELQ